MSEKSSCPEADCGVDICVWSMGSLLDSKTREKREGGGGHRIQNRLPIQSS
jgi:hypothetical protein